MRALWALNWDCSGFMGTQFTRFLKMANMAHHFLLFGSIFFFLIFIVCGVIWNITFLFFFCFLFYEKFVTFIPLFSRRQKQYILSQNQLNPLTKLCSYECHWDADQARICTAFFACLLNLRWNGLL